MPIINLPGREPSPQEHQQALVEQLKQGEKLLDAATEAAFLAVPRHLFLPEGLTLAQAYADEAIPVKRGADGSVVSSASQPSMMALMLRQMRLRPGDNVLEIGAGTGYFAALIQNVVGEGGTVTTIEVDPEMAERAEHNLQRVSLGGMVTVVAADGALGYAPRASYDRIVATAALWDVPPAWIRQLKPDGLLVAPMWLEGMQVSAAFLVQPDGTLFSRSNISCGFIPLRGLAQGPRLSRRVSGSTLTLSSSQVKQIDSAALHLLLSDGAEINNLGSPLSSQEYWRGFLPFVTLNIPKHYQFALYQVAEDQNDYGLEDQGFALISRGSACFALYTGKGKVFCYGSADAFLALRDLLAAWEAAGRPTTERLRLQLMPIDAPDEAETRPNHIVYRREAHRLHVWLEL